MPLTFQHSYDQHQSLTKFQFMLEIKSHKLCHMNTLALLPANYLTLHEEISNYNFKLVSRKIDNSGTLSKNDFWKIKKKLFPKSHSVPHAVLNKVGNELTDPQNIILAYGNEMFHRLQKRLIRGNLKDYESAMNQLCRHRLHKARTAHSPDFSLSEGRNAISELKEGRCIDPTGFVREIFTRAGTGLMHSVVTMLNMIKKKWQVPSRWAEMYICTLYKQKGSWKELENHRGIFIVVIVSIIFEKVLKNCVTPILRENMTKFQTGGIKGKGVVDNLFISHSLYVNQPLFLTVYDIENCFDSLWLEDCINSLWQNGVENDNLYLIYLLKKKASITIKTPLGNASPFVIKNFVKQVQCWDQY